MPDILNPLGQPIGASLPDWTARPRPQRLILEGHFCRLEPLDPRHGPALFAAFGDDGDGRGWTYLTYGPFGWEDFDTWLRAVSLQQDPVFFAIVDTATGEAVGVASYLRIDPSSGVIEVGHLHYAPRLQRKPAATEAMYLMMRYAFEDLGYRRYEWKCDTLNAPSRAAAERLGFRFEGIFRQAIVYKNRSRDTAWYSIIDSEWPARRDAFERWLDPANFDTAGQQIKKLSAI